MLDLKSLRYFISAVETGSITAAAKACHVAQPSITLAISKLEDRFDTALLERSRTGVTPTPKGHALYQRSVELMLHADAVETSLNLSIEKPKITIAVNRSVQVSYVEHLTRINSKLPVPAEFEIIETDEGADLILTTQLSAPKKQTFYPIAKESYALLIPSKSLLAHKQTLTILDLHEQPLVERSNCENRVLFEQFMANTQLEMPVVAKVDNEEWALSLVAAGLGLSISPLTENFQDARFKVIRLSSLLDVETPARQIGICINSNISANKQSILDEIGRQLVSEDRLSA